MANRPASWFLGVAIGGAIMALVMVGATEWVMHAGLSLWLHIPLTIAVLTLMAGGAAVTGAAFLEYRERAPKASPN